MTLLAELFDLLENEPAPSGNGREQAGIPTPSANVAKVATLAPASNGYRPATGSRQATAAAPAPAATSAPVAPRNAPAQNVAQTEGAPAARRNAWTITRGGRPICTICGAPMTRDEALAEARWRWPDAEIE
ncbi:hypothetical protein ACFOJE_02085 [Azotobacter bryophylli]|uniref:Uncharacterized protein n=1 Tax=Azotobacter bryophylli TaxID=1986537 RepID=A0ABV7AQ42_9GAMM